MLCLDYTVSEASVLVCVLCSKACLGLLLTNVFGLLTQILEKGTWSGLKSVLFFFFYCSEPDSLSDLLEEEESIEIWISGFMSSLGFVETLDSLPLALKSLFVSMFCLNSTVAEASVLICVLCSKATSLLLKPSSSSLLNLSLAFSSVTGPNIPVRSASCSNLDKFDGPASVSAFCPESFWSSLCISSLDNFGGPASMSASCPESFWSTLLCISRWECERFFLFTWYKKWY